MSNREKTDQNVATSCSVNIGHGNIITRSRILAILEAGSLPVRRLRERSLESNRLIDATAGRKTRSLIVLDSEHVVLSALATQTLQERLEQSATLRPWSESELVS